MRDKADQRQRDRGVEMKAVVSLAIRWRASAAPVPGAVGADPATSA